MAITLAIFFIMTSASAAVKYPNDIEGSPIIECNKDAISIHVNTTNRMASKLFAKNYLEDSKCLFKTVNSATFSLGACGMTRKRQLEPKGLAYSIVVIVQLHPTFITKVDRAYNVKCFYTESLNTVSAGLEVSMLQTDTVTSKGAGADGAISAEKAPPSCTYSLHLDSPAGTTVKYAKVGDKVWHLWECDSSDAYGMLIHSCYVTDGQGNEFQILDSNGCGIDEYVLRTPEYSVTLNKAQQETHVFKFADKMVVLFNCQVKLCLKANSGCRGMAPPDCSNTTVSGITGERLEISTESFRNTSDHGGVFNESVETSSSLDGATTESSLNETTMEKKENAENSTNDSEPGSTTESAAGNKTETEMEGKTTEHANETFPEKGESSNSTETSPEAKTESSMKNEAESESGLKTTTSLESESNRTGKVEGDEESGKKLEVQGNLTSETAKPESFLFHLFFSRNESSSKNVSGAADVRERRNTATDEKKNPADKGQGSKLKPRLLKDSVEDVHESHELETDVSQRIWVLEPEESSPFEESARDHGERGSPDSRIFNGDFENDQYRRSNTEVCLPTSKFSFVVASGVFFLILSSVFCLCLCFLVKRKRNESLTNSLSFSRPIGVEPPTVYTLFDKN